MTTGQDAVNSRSASALHARLQEGTRKARQMADLPAVAAPRRQRRINEATLWNLLENLCVSGSVEPALRRDEALRRVLAALLQAAPRAEQPVPIPSFAGPMLIVRSGPWPLLRALIHELSQEPLPELTVLCHRRDQAMLEEVSRSAGLPLRPLFYPKFEPCSPSTLQRMLEADRTDWTATFVLDSAPSGTSRSLDHVTRTLAAQPGDRFVWNASGQLFRQLSLVETVGKERYDIVRRLLRWRAGEPDAR
jgi:hypothetical protein